MNRRHHLGLLLTLAGSVTGCRSLQAEASSRTPAELTATAVATDPRATPTPSVRVTPTPYPTITPRATPPEAPSPAVPAIPSVTHSAALGKLAYVQAGDIWVQDIPDGTPRCLTRDGSNDSPLWSPSGDWLAFFKKADASYLRQLWVMRATGTDARTVGAIHLGQGIQGEWSPLADRLAYLTDNGLFVEHADGQARQQLVVQTRTPTGPSGINALAWSPDGTWLAYERLEWGATPAGGANPPSPASQGLWRVKADGSEVHDVYLNPQPGQTQSYLAGWAPDSQRLLYWGGQGMSASLAMDGGPLQAVAVSGGNPIDLGVRMLMHRDFLSWSPDGQQLSLVDGAGRSTWYNKSLVVTSLNGPKRTVSDPNRSDLFPAWSPDGHWIAYTDASEVRAEGGNDASRAMTQRSIWLMKPDGTEKRRLTADQRFDDERPEWSHDGAEILFARMDGDTAELWLMRADGSNPRRVVDTLSPSPGKLGTYGYHDWTKLYDWWRHETP